jgi:hypothetical protein
MSRWLADHEGASRLWLEDLASGRLTPTDPQAVSRALAREILDVRETLSKLAYALNALQASDDEGEQ